MKNLQPLPQLETVPGPIMELQPIPPTPASMSQADGMLQMAIQQGMPVESLKELVALRNDELKRLAKGAFVRAMAQFQALVPAIAKSKRVNFKHKEGGGATDYKYAPLYVIADTIKEAMKECGLAYRWEIVDKQENNIQVITVTCVLTHVDGHSESNAMSGGADNSGKKNPIQQRGSTITYLQRYTLIGVLGLTTADEDNDGGGSDDEAETISEGGGSDDEAETISEEQYTQLHAILTDAGHENPNRQLTLLARSIVGSENPRDIPADKFTEAKDKLKEGLKARAARPQK